MKKFLIFLPLILTSCNKQNEKVMNTDKDSVKTIADSTTKGIVSIDEASEKPEISKNAFRVVEGDKIIKTINGDMLPMEISDEFTTTNQQMIIKIKNFNGSKISGKVTPTNPKLNIRFNQIRLANAEFDGPFGAEINYDIKPKGEIWLIIGKNLMADGESTGKFTVSLK